MGKGLLALVGCAIAFNFSQNALALRVVACEPEWASLAKEIGGKLVAVRSATSAGQDAHHTEARPTLTAITRSADLLVCTGFGVEDDWLPVLLSTSGNPRIQRGKPGYLEAAQYVAKLRAPALQDYGQANLRQHESYHVYGDPRNVSIMADAILKRLIEIDPQNEASYALNHSNFTARWSKAIESWEKQAAPLKGVSVIQHHNAWTYLCDWLGIRVAATLEPQQGQGTTERHIEAVFSTLGRSHASMILVGPYDDVKAAQKLADRAKIPLVELPVTVGSSKEAEDLFGLFDDIIKRLVAALNPQHTRRLPPGRINSAIIQVKHKRFPMMSFFA